MAVTHIQHTVTCDTSNSGTIAATSDTAGNRAIGYTVLSSIAVQVFKNNWYVTRTKFGSIDGEATYIQQQVRPNNFKRKYIYKYAGDK